MLELVIGKILMNPKKYDISLGTGVFVYVIKLVGLGLDILSVLYNPTVRQQLSREISLYCLVIIDNSTNEKLYVSH